MNIARVVLVSLVFATVAFSQVSYIEVHDYDVEARVDTTRCNWGIGKSTGQQLTFEFPDPYPLGNSNFVLLIDGESYGPSHIIPMLDHSIYPFKPDGYPRIISATNTIHNKWIITLMDSTGEIVVNQYFAPVLLDSLGMIEIHYVIENDGFIPHTVALEHKYDVSIDGRDDAAFMVSCVPIDTNSVWTSAIPAEITMQNLLSPILAGRIIPNAHAATCPDLFAYGDETLLIPSIFDIDTSFAGGSYCLSAALLRWDGDTIPPGDSIDIITYYGLGDTCFTGIAETPLPEDFAIEVYPNPFNASVNISVAGTIHELPLLIDVYDINGRMVAKIPATGSESAKPLSMTASGACRWSPDKSIGSGVYLVKAKIGNASITKRVVYLK